MQAFELPNYFRKMTPLERLKWIEPMLEIARVEIRQAQVDMQAQREL